MKLKTKKVDEWYEGRNSPENEVEYAIVEAESGKDTGYAVRRIGIDLAELRNPDGEDEYLSSSDLRHAIPEALRIVRRRLFKRPK